MQTTETLNTKSLTELAALYNDNCAPLPAIKKFSSKPVAVKRILALQEEQGKLEFETPISPKESNNMKKTSKVKAKAAPKKAATKKVATKKVAAKKDVKKEAPKKAAKGTRARKLFDLPFKAPLKTHREGTARDKAIIILKKGATFAEVQKATGWTLHRHCYEGIRLLNTHLGYGVKEDDKGLIKLSSK